jgi:hypothetical protein
MTEDAECAQNIKAFIAQMIDSPLRQQVASPTWKNAGPYDASQTITISVR